MWRWSWSNKTHVEILLNKFLQSFLFRCWKRVYRTNWRLCTLFQIDFEVIRTMRRENFSFCLAKNITKFMILRRDIREIRSFCKFCGVGLNVWRTKTKFEIVGAWKFWCMQEYCSTNDSNVMSLRVIWKPWSLMIVESCPKRTEISIVCWLQCERERDFPAKMDGSILTHLPSQSVDCVGRASCIQGPKSRRNQAEWYRSPDSYNHQWKKLWASWQFLR